MKSLEQYSIPINGMNLGVHKYEFLIGNSFFKHFESSLFENGQLSVQIFFDKRPAMITVDFSIEGHLNVECDRCLQPIALPLKKEYQVLIKYSEEPAEDGEVLYITQKHPQLIWLNIFMSLLCWQCL